MEKFYGDSGEILEFVGSEQHTIRGVLETDGVYEYDHGIKIKI